MTTISTRFSRRLSYCLVALGFSFAAHGQTAPLWESAATLGPGTDASSRSRTDAAGNTYEIGGFSRSTVIGTTTLTSLGANDAYLAKYTPAGTLAWVRQLGSPDVDLISGVALDLAGNVYVTGTAGGFIDLGNSLALAGSGPRGYVVRYSPQGTPEWAQQPSNPTVTGIGTDAAGHVYMAGRYTAALTLGTATLTAPDEPAIFLARLSAASGAVLSLTKAFQYAPTTDPAAGQGGAPSLAVAATGEVFLLSTFSQRKPVFPSGPLTTRGGANGLVAKYSAQGTFEWVQQLGGPIADYITDGVVDATGSLYVAGEFSGPSTFGTTTLPGAGLTDGFLAKYSPQGTLAWAKSGGGSSNDTWLGVSLDAAGNPYVTGSFNATASFDGTSLLSAGLRDVAVAAYTPTGQLRWAQRAGGPGNDTGINLGLDAANKVYVNGRIDLGTATFGSFVISAANNSFLGEVFIARLGNTTLNTRSARPITPSFYPNPATTVAYLPGVPALSRIELLDALGRQVRTAVASSSASISVQGLTPGLYTLRATDMQGQQYIARIAVE